MSRTYDFILGLAESETPPPARLLDFGCGAGQVVAKALAAGYDAHGVDLFNGGWFNQHAAAAAALGPSLHAMPSATQLPFENSSFDIILSNQVFEHIEHKSAVIAELARVLRPGGRLIAIFPTREILIEPHLKTPLVHRLRNNSPAQRRLLTLAHRLGLTAASPLPRHRWVADAINSLTTDIFYIPDRDVPPIFSPGFTLVRQAEPDFLHDRLITSRLKPLAALLNHSLADEPLRSICLRLANGVYIFSRV